MHYGLDIGGTKIEIAAFDATLKPVASQRIATPTDDYQAFLGAIQQLIVDFDQRYGVTGSVGIGLPGVEDRSTGLLHIANIPAVHGRNLRKDLSERMQRTVILENDARCFVYSEAVGGSADSYQRVFGAILGTGAGGGFTIDKNLYDGASQIAGEWGHIGLPATLQQKYQLPLHPCGCGLTGCYETYIAGPGLVRLYQHFSRSEAMISPAIIAELMRTGDKDASAAFACFLDITGAALANLMLVVDPDAFVIGGGISNIPEIYQQLPEAVAGHLFGGRRSAAILAPAFGDSGGVRGAAILGAAHCSGLNSKIA